MSEPLVQVPLSEYQELIEIKNKFVTAFNEKKMIMHTSVEYYSCTPVVTYSIVNESDVIENMAKRIDDFHKQNNDYVSTIFKLKEDHRRHLESHICIKIPF